jgi:hypothetical protein
MLAGILEPRRHWIFEAVKKYVAFSVRRPDRIVVGAGLSTTRIQKSSVGQ